MSKSKVRFPVRFECGFSKAQSDFLDELVRGGRFESLRAAVRWCVSQVMTDEPKAEKGVSPQ